MSTSTVFANVDATFSAPHLPAELVGFRTAPNAKRIGLVNVAQMVPAVFVVTAGCHIAASGHHHGASQTETTGIVFPPRRERSIRILAVAIKFRIFGQHRGCAVKSFNLRRFQHHTVGTPLAGKPLDFGNLMLVVTEKL